MPQRYFIRLSYDGTPFHGWQIQPNAKSIQQSLNEVLSTITRHEIYVVGCGRTDTGVHARKFYAHFESDRLTSLGDITFHANCMLPKEIAIQSIFEVDGETHARFSATLRTYEYLINTEKDPFAVNRSYEYREPLDMDAMNVACRNLMEYEDFTSFSKLHTDTETNLCNVTKAEWIRTEIGLKFEISANRFLRNMVRAIVGTMIEVGRGKLTLEDFRKIIEAQDRSTAGFSAPAHGLYLIDIGYPEGLLKHE
ncbi:MAG: tRNA pseudouridine(38-40) synthase TruA [Flavobacteriales bacterium]